MAGSSVSHLVLFIASVGIAVGVAGILITTVGDVSSAVTDRGEDLSTSLETQVSVISDPGRGVVYDDAENNVTLLVKNTGSVDIDLREDEIDVLIDGGFVENKSITVVSTNSDVWLSGEVVEITAEDVSLDAGDHRAVVVVNGNKEVFEFRT
jgi:flagellar protein FlaG